MKKIAFLCLALVSLAVSSHADPTAEKRHIVVAAYKASDAAVAHKDSKTLLSQLVPNYQLYNIKGQTLSRSDMSRHMQEWFSKMKLLRTRTVVTNVTVSNAKITVLAKEYGNAVGINPQTKKKITVISNSYFRDTWGKINGRWLKLTTRTIRQELLVNGKRRKL